MLGTWVPDSRTTVPDDKGMDGVWPIRLRDYATALEMGKPGVCLLSRFPRVGISDSSSRNLSRGFVGLVHYSKVVAVVCAAG